MESEIHKTKQANQYYKDKRYEDALDLYRQLDKQIGSSIFSLNIEMCKKKIKEKNYKIKARPHVNIAYILDANFSLPTYVSLYSLQKNKDEDTEYTIHLLAIDIQRQEIRVFESMERDDFNIKIINISDEYNKFSITKNGFHVSTAAILKFKLPELLKDLDKVLYIDGDTIINKDLYDFYCSDLHEFYAAVIEDIKPKYHYKPNILEKLKIKKHRGYFNSGVLLLNLQKMRVEGIVEKLFDYRENGLNFFMDQDALNVIFSDNVKYVSCLYNFLVTLPDNFSLDEMKKNYLSLDGYKDFQQIYSNSYIVHFSSKDKPWKTRGVRFSEYWNRYYLESKAYEKNLFFHHEIKKFLLEKEIILSFTSFPKRINLMEDVIAKLLNQSYRPNKIILWLAKDQFPNKEKDLPNYLKNIDGNNFYIEWCEDIKSYKKLVPSLRIFKDATVVTCDDDILYDKNWLLELVAEYLKNPEVIHCHRAHEISLDTENMPLTYKKWRRNTKNEKISYRNFFTGCGGVLYPQNTFDKRVLDSEKFMNICSHGDDIWFWGMAVMNKKKINVIQNSCFKLTHSPHTQDDALWIENDQGGRNDVMLKNLFTEFNELNNVLGNESLTDLD